MNKLHFNQKTSFVRGIHRVTKIRNNMKKPDSINRAFGETEGKDCRDFISSRTHLCKL